LVGGDGETHVGAPEVADAIVRAEVVEHGRGEKIIVFRYKSKVRYRRKTGHRQSLTRLKITDILLGGVSTAKPAPEPEPVDVEPVDVAPAADEEAATPKPAARRRRAAPAAETESEAPAEETKE